VEQRDVTLEHMHEAVQCREEVWELWLQHLVAEADARVAEMARKLKEELASETEEVEEEEGEELVPQMPGGGFGYGSPVSVESSSPGSIEGFLDDGSTEDSSSGEPSSPQLPPKPHKLSRSKRM
jgi:hypothetical protein